MKKNGNQNRLDRINDGILRETSDLIRSEIKDPRLPLMTSVTKVDTTRDLSYCKIYVSVMGTKDEQGDAMEALKSSAGFLRSQLAKRINLRNTPELKFIIDETMDYSFKMSKLIDEANQLNKEENDDAKS